jgi:hypothetical protein
MKRRIRQTVWGNWNGYEGTRKAYEFGTDAIEAESWLATGKTDFPRVGVARPAPQKITFKPGYTEA